MSTERLPDALRIVTTKPSALLYAWPVVKVGQLYRSLRDEIDSADPDDEEALPFLNDDGERVTPAGSTWRVTSHNNGGVWDIVCDETGGWICPTEAELAEQFVRVQ